MNANSFATNCVGECVPLLLAGGAVTLIGCWRADRPSRTEQCSDAHLDSMAAGAASSIASYSTHSTLPALDWPIAPPRTGGRGVAQRAAGAREAAGRADPDGVTWHCSGTTEPRAL
eukprot:2726943-Prymnesium_polylepis.1